jgi:hypothetical protein
MVMTTPQFSPHVKLTTCQDNSYIKSPNLIYPAKWLFFFVQTLHITATDLYQTLLSSTAPTPNFLPIQLKLPLNLRPKLLNSSQYATGPRKHLTVPSPQQGRHHTCSSCTRPDRVHGTWPMVHREKLWVAGGGRLSWRETTNF